MAFSVFTGSESARADVKETERAAPAIKTRIMFFMVRTIGDGPSRVCRIGRLPGPREFRQQQIPAIRQAARGAPAARGPCHHFDMFCAANSQFASLSITAFT